LLSAREQRQALGPLARRRDLYLHALIAGLVLGARRPRLARRVRFGPFGIVVGAARPDRRSAWRGFLVVVHRQPAEDRTENVRLAHQPELPRAAGEQLAGELREVAGRRLEGLVEGLPELTGGG